jgi:DNA-directed RNA polymerase subunit F
MIKNIKPLSMAESLEYINKDEGSGADVIGFIKKFTNLETKDAKELKKNLKNLKLIKMNDNNIVKIIDLLPKNSEELNKIFTDVNLDEDETKKILDTVKQHK